MHSDTYTTIKSFSEGSYREKGSRFLSFAYPITSQDGVKPLLDKVRKEHYDASHHCYAYMIGHERNIWRINDDGEPSGTAGKPILGQINSFGITNVLVIVTRYFGGTLLGVSGLINAYKSAAASSIKNASIIECTVNVYYEIIFPYHAMNDVMKILKEEEIDQSDHSFDLECRINLNFRVSHSEKILQMLSLIEGLECRYIETQ